MLYRRYPGGLDLHAFIKELKENDHNIKLTSSFDLRSIPFLDLRIYKNYGHLETSTYRKPTAANTLRVDSFHPKSIV